jgi:hypothetical protein
VQQSQPDGVNFLWFHSQATTPNGCFPQMLTLHERARCNYTTSIRDKKLNRETGRGKGKGRQAGQDEESPAREVGGDADVGAGGPGGGYKVHAPRRRWRLSTLRGPRRRIPGRRGRGGDGGRLAALLGKRARDFGGSEGRREAHLSPGRRGGIVGGIRIHVRGRNLQIGGWEEISDVMG